MLAEANIPIADLEREARAAVIPAMREHLKHLWDHYLSAYPGVQDSDTWADDRFQLFDDFREWLIRSEESKKAFVQVLMNQPSVGLAKMARKSVRNCQVHVVCREYSTDPHRHYGGYFNYYRHIDSYIIMCFVNAIDVLAAAEQAIHDIIFGEAYDDAMDRLANIVVPVFVHEFTHLQQELRNPNRPFGNSQPDRDPGITTVGGGKRGGRRRPDAGKIGWARYTGSLHEIEAFASQTAVELLQEIKTHRGRDAADNTQIDRLLADIAAGWGDSKSYNSMNHMRTYWEEFKEAGVSERERDLVWKRYLKLLYQKIWQFRAEKIGKTNSYTGKMIRAAPEQWRNWASLGMVKCVNLISRDVAFHCASQVDDYDTAERLSRFDPLAEQAVMFCERYFFEEKWDYQESLKITLAIQRLIARQIEREVEGRK